MRCVRLAGLLFLNLATLTCPAQTAGPIAHWRFDERPGSAVATNTAATTGGSFNGTLSGAGAGIVSGGRAGNALSLDRASGGFVTVGNFPNFDPGTNFTLIAWVRTTDGTTDSFILGKHSVAPNSGYSLRLSPAGVRKNDRNN